MISIKIFFILLILFNSITSYYWFKIFFKTFPSYQIIETKGTIVGDSFYKIKIVWKYNTWEIFDFYSNDKKHAFIYNSINEAKSQIDYFVQKYENKIIYSYPKNITSFFEYCPNCKTKANFHIHENKTFTCLNCICTFDFNSNIISKNVS